MLIFMFLGGGSVPECLHPFRLPALEPGMANREGIRPVLLCALRATTQVQQHPARLDRIDGGYFTALGAHDRHG